MLLDTIFIIPARMASTRLPNKLLADINGKPMIQHVFERTRASNLGPVIVACDHIDVASIIEKLGGHYVMTEPSLPSGSDRIFQALQTIDPENKFKKIVNVQGDLPTIDHATLEACLLPLNDLAIDIGTLAKKIHTPSERDDPNVVKIALSINPASNLGHAVYFSRSPIPYGADTYYHHIGIYAYKRSALQKFVHLPSSQLEKIERLEQLRALENGLKIGVQLVDKAPWGVDTEQDLSFVRQLLGN